LPRASRVGRKVSKKATNKMNPGQKCETCGKPLEYRGIGRPRKFCGEECWSAAHNEARRVVPAYVYRDGVNVPNPSPRPKSKVR
jgi:endogenous inhibitor of DNA gyrase (YacG/DUF329 family)